MFKVKKVLSVLLTGTILFSSMLHVPTSANAETVTGFKISGYVVPDITSSDAAIKSGTKIELVGTTKSTVTDNNGYFELSNLTASITGYTIKISKTGFLCRNIINVAGNANVQIGTSNLPVDLWVGDVTLDNVTNMADIMQVAKYFNTVAGDGKFSIDYDFNKDNAVNMTEIMSIAKYFNKTSGDYPAVNQIISTSTPTTTSSVTPTPTKTSTVTPTPTALPTSKNGALWLWNGMYQLINNTIDPRFSSTLKARDALKNFTSKTYIDTLYFSIDFVPSSGGTLLQEAKLKEFISWCHANNLKIHALVGYYEGCLPENHDKVLAVMDKILAYNASSQKVEQFDGVNLDVEPESLSGSLLKNPNQVVHKSYLDMLQKVSTKLKSKLTFGECVANWFDTSTASYCTSVTWNGKTKTFFEHIADVCDYVAMMDCMNNKEAIVSAVTNEVKYIESINKKIVIGVNLREEQDSESFTITADPASGVRNMEDAVKYIHSTFKNYKGFDGVATHHYHLYITQRGANEPPLVIN